MSYTSNAGVSLLSDQPIGEQVGMGLNGSHEAGEQAALRADIAAALIEGAGALSRRDVFNRFSSRMGSARLYELISDEVSKSGIPLAPTKQAPRAGRPTMTGAEQRAEVAKLMPQIDAVAVDLEAATTAVSAAADSPVLAIASPSDDDRPDWDAPGGPPVSAPPTNRPMDLAKRIHDSFDVIDSMMEDARPGGGAVRNKRLAITLVDLGGKTAERLGRLQAQLDDQSEVVRYLDALMASIKRRVPASVRREISSDLRELNRSWGL